MPASTRQSRAAPYSKVFTISDEDETIDTGRQSAPGADAFRWYPPDSEDGRSSRRGIVVRSIRLTTGTRTTAASTCLLDVQNQTTSMLTATISTTTANTTVVGTLSDRVANFGDPTIVTAGRFISIDLNGGANAWSNTTGWATVTVQINYDDWPGVRPSRTP